MSSTYVTRGGDKLAAALDHFGIDVNGLICADLGSHVGGFVDCLLQRGAARVHSVDTAYGILAWKLRKDPRVVVFERTNAMHAQLPERVDLVTIDAGWTKQEKILPNVRILLARHGRVVSLVKPHYEIGAERLDRGILPESEVPAVVDDVVRRIAAAGWEVRDTFASPLPGHGGNVEVFALLKNSNDTPPLNLKVERA